MSEAQLEHIPASGRVIIVANHPIGSLDGLALLRLLGRIRPDVKIVANQLLAQLTPLRPCCCRWTTWAARPTGAPFWRWENTWRAKGPW